MFGVSARLLPGRSASAIVLVIDDVHQAGRPGRPWARRRLTGRRRVAITQNGRRGQPVPVDLERAGRALSALSCSSPNLGRPVSFVRGDLGQPVEGRGGVQPVVVAPPRYRRPSAGRASLPRAYDGHVIPAAPARRRQSTSRPCRTQSVAAPISVGAVKNVVVGHDVVAQRLGTRHRTTAPDERGLGEVLGVLRCVARGAAMACSGSPEVDAVD